MSETITMVSPVTYTVPSVETHPPKTCVWLSCRVIVIVTESPVATVSSWTVSPSMSLSVLVGVTSQIA